MKRNALTIIGLAALAGVTTIAGCSGGEPPYDAATAVDPAMHATMAQGEPTMTDPHSTSPDKTNEAAPAAANIDPDKMTDDQWRAILSDAEYRILRHAATERPGTGRYLYNKDAGVYYCAGCGQALYESSHKFDSGCGWPSFFKEITDGSVTRIEDRTLGMVRTEIRCSRCDGHLGHVFADAPDQPTGMRHCLNGTSLIFVPEGGDVHEAIKKHREANAGK